MADSWLILKCAGMGVQASYLVLLLAVFWQFRRQLARMRFRWVAPIIVGNFVALSVPWIFESVAVSRACFIVAQAIYLCGMAILVTDLTRGDVTVTRAAVDASM